MNIDTVGLPPDDAAPNETHDFHGFTASADAPGQAVSIASKAAFDGWVGEQKEKPSWLALYQEVFAEQGAKPAGERWDWRKCLYVAWRCAPAKTRWPAKLDELASFMGLRNTATIRHWRTKDTSIEERIKTGRVQLVDDHVTDLLEAAVNCALNDAEKGHQDRKMLLEIAGVYKSKTTHELTGANGGPVRTVHEMTDEELEHIAAGSR